MKKVFTQKKKKVFPRTSFQLLTVCWRYYVVIIRPPWRWWWRQLCPPHSMCSNSLLMPFGQYKYGMTVFPFRFDWIFLLVRVVHIFLRLPALVLCSFTGRWNYIPAEIIKPNIFNIYGWILAIAVTSMRKEKKKKQAQKLCPSIWERRQRDSTKRMQFTLFCVAQLGWDFWLVLFCFTVLPVHGRTICRALNSIMYSPWGDGIFVSCSTSIHANVCMRLTSFSFFFSVFNTANSELYYFESIAINMCAWVCAQFVEYIFVQFVCELKVGELGALECIRVQGFHLVCTESTVNYDFVRVLQRDSRAIFIAIHNVGCRHISTYSTHVCWANVVSNNNISNFQSHLRCAHEPI